ncbi:MAG: YesL family protein [Clostridia bacterium]|nr:YesL family protein [Clostridia bacterium]
MGLFNGYIKPGKGVHKKDVAENFGFKRFFTTFGDKFWRIVTLNLIYFLVNCPIFGLFAYLAGVGGTPYMTPAGVMYQPLHGVMLHGANPALDALHGVVGVQVPNNYPSGWTYLLLVVGLLTLLTFGLSNAAMTYIHRNFIRREPVDLAEDFFHCIKRNFKQALLLGLVDAGILFLIAFDLVSYIYSNQNFGMLLLLYLTGFLSVLYLLMRPYMYLMCVTFDLKISKILKNSWILAISGLGRNLFCSFFALLVLVLNVLVFAFIPSLGVGMLFIFTVSIAWFFQIYGAWPVIKRHMIDPFYEEVPADAPKTEEAVFEDRG